jgi:hypothetical protein
MVSGIVLLGVQPSLIKWSITGSQSLVFSPKQKNIETEEG